MRRLFPWMPDTFIVNTGLTSLTAGFAIVLLYHGILVNLLPPGEDNKEVIAYAGHLITFLGMLLTLGGILIGDRKPAHDDMTAVKK